uniref:Cell cycle associated protein 1b n=1 Tax=Esox lucius TaxID=8010 RepID=A0A6Q2YKL8_ESOLU
MPSAMNGNRTVQSASPDVGSVSGQITQGGQSSGAQTEAMKQVLGVIDKKVRNMEKKKGKLDDYQARKNKGERLNQDQLDALTKYQEVANNLEFARELQKSFLTLGQDIQKAVKKAARREQLKREEAEQKRLKTVLEVQFLLDRLGEDAVRQELRQGSVAGAPSLLTDAELTALDDLYKLVGPERDQNARLADQYEEASQHFMDLLEGKDKAVAGTTYKALKESLDRVLLSGYFDKAQSRQNGVCEEEEDEEEEEEEEESAIVVVESSEAEEVHRSCPVINAAATASDLAPPLQAISPTQQQPVESSPPPVALETHPLNGAPPAVRPADPVVRKQAVQDLLSQMQGPYNFMQDSMLEFDGQPIDPAIVSAQPMKPAPQNLGLSPMGCAPVHAEPRLSPHNTVSVPPEPAQVSVVSSTPPPIYQSSHTTPHSTPGASMSLCSEQQGFQPVSKPLHSSGINVNAAPFQSMQTVFNLNAPVPPANETEALNVASQYQNSYSQQGFNQSQQLPVEQTEQLQTEQLQSGEPSWRLSRCGYDGYRPPFANAPNSGYQQAPFNTPRDYSNGGNYQRGDGYNQSYKRGTGQGPRGASRGGSAQPVRS